MIVTPSGRNVLLVEGAIPPDCGILMSQYVQESIGRVSVRLVVDGTFSEGVAARIRQDLQYRIGEDVVVELTVVPELERTASGKTPFVISRLRE
jgi:hypothetical protein